MVQLQVGTKHCQLHFGFYLVEKQRGYESEAAAHFSPVGKTANQPANQVYFCSHRQPCRFFLLVLQFNEMSYKITSKKSGKKIV